MKGSSPRVWEQEPCNVEQGEGHRIIPTRVGTSFGFALFTFLVWDHPHACGDKRDMQAITATLKRIIPTRVGTSIFTVFIYVFSQDHPHACGDKDYITNRSVCQYGSSPRVWGQASCLVARLYCFRIIPTRVGTSSYGKGS